MNSNILQNKTDEWLVSDNEESWHMTDSFSTKGVAAAEGRDLLELEDDDLFFVGRKKNYIPSIQCGESFVEDLIERDRESFGDWAESWISRVYANKNLHKRIEEKLREISAIILEEEKPNFFLIEDIEAVEASP